LRLLVQPYLSTAFFGETFFSGTVAKIRTQFIQKLERKKRTMGFAAFLAAFIKFLLNPMMIMAFANLLSKALKTLG